jgi:hypothetical protein
MARYSLKSFLTLIPKAQPKKYFQKYKYIPDYDWDKEEDVEKLCDTLKQCTDFERIEMDFRTIHKWANDTGISNLVEEARSPIHGNLELGEELRKMENEHEAAMYVRLEYPKVFYWATELESWEYRTGKKHYYVGTGLPCDGNDEEIRTKLLQSFPFAGKIQGMKESTEPFKHRKTGRI